MRQIDQKSIKIFYNPIGQLTNRKKLIEIWFYAVLLASFAIFPCNEKQIWMDFYRDMPHASHRITTDKRRTCTRWEPLFSEAWVMRATPKAKLKLDARKCFADKWNENNSSAFLFPLPNIKRQFLACLRHIKMWTVSETMKLSLTTRSVSFLREVNTYHIA